MIRRVLPFFLFLFAMFAQMAAAQDAKPSASPDQLSTADTLYKTGKLDEAARQYEALLANDPKMVHARVGLMQVRLRQQRADDAYVLGNAGIAMPGFTAELLAEMGDVQFRRGEMGAAGDSYFHALKVDPAEWRAHLGLARLYRAYSMYRKSYDQLKTAHEIAPQDPEVQRAWYRMLPRKERLQSIENYLSSPHPEEEAETLGRMRETAEYLKATADKPSHACRLISKVDKTQLPLVVLLRDANHTHGFGLQVKLNDRSCQLMLDTGAGGIVLGRKAAERAGLERIANQSLAGIGDNGLQSGYTAVAKRIRIGELEFEDCVVSVSDRSVVDDDGLIGTNVLSSYLIDLDGPNKVLRLAPLPKRPEEATTATALKTDEDKEDEDEAVTSEREARSKTEIRLPKDRYVAPEMSDWTKVFRLGHQLLIPTHVNDSPSMLFLIDTGSFSNVISTTAARKFSNVFKDDRTTVKGMNGTVKDVYMADKVKLQFSRFSQQNQDILTFDLSSLSKQDGIEVSGMLGYLMLRWLEVKIDYRDGLVDFSYNPKLLPAFLR